MKSGIWTPTGLTSEFARELTRISAAVVAPFALLLIWTGISLAGNPVDELNHRYGCSVGGKGANSQYQSRGEPWTVGVEIGANNDPVIVINERTTYEQPFEVAAFEYFSACEQMKVIMSANNRLQLTTNRVLAGRMLFRADCKAIGRMQREGLMRGSRSATTLINALYYQRAKQSYINVLFSSRADNIRKICPP